MDGPEFFCSYCDKDMKNQTNYQRHASSLQCKRNRNAENKIKCPHCPSTFMGASGFRKHMSMFHPKDGERKCFVCGICNKGFVYVQDLKDHQTHRHHEKNKEFQLMDTAHGGQTKKFRLFFPDKVLTLEEALLYSNEKILNLIEENASSQKTFRINICMNVEMSRYDENGEVMLIDTFSFRPEHFSFDFMRWEQVKDKLHEALNDVESKVLCFLNQGSGWVVNKPLYLDAHLCEYIPLRGHSCFMHPVTYVRNKGIEVDQKSMTESNDGACFYYAVAYHFMHVHDKEVLKEFALKNFHFAGKDMAGGVTLKDVDDFEEANAHLDLAINIIYQDEDKKLVPVRASKKLKAANMVPLLLSHSVAGKDEKVTATPLMHFSFLQDPEHLFAKRYQYKDEKNRTSTKGGFICWNCFNIQNRKDTHMAHVAFCHQNSCQKVIMPRFNQTLAFEPEEEKYARRSSSRGFKSAFMLFFDFETLQMEPEGGPCACTEEMRENRQLLEDLRKTDTPEEAAEVEMELMNLCAEAEVMMEQGILPRRKINNGCPLDVCTHKKHVLKDQKAFTYNLILVNREGEVLEDKSYVGMDAPVHFVDAVLDIAEKYLPSVSPGKPMDELTEEEKARVEAADKCYLCQNRLEKQDRVLDHDHLTGKFLGVAHSLCNLQRKEVMTLNAFAHNLSGYDSHVFIKEMANNARVKSMQAIPLNTQKFKAFTINSNIRFLDSYAFLSASLSDLVDNLVASDHEFPILKQFIREEEKLALLKRKGVYPYSFATDIDVLANTTELPPKCVFKNDIGDNDITQEEYAHAQRVFKTFGCGSMMDYTQLYVRSDVYLLAECLVDARNTLWDEFHLDLCQYLSLPMMSLDMMLKYTDCEISLIRDQEMSDLLQRNIRGGFSFINQRHAEATPGDFEELPNSMVYLDANNLYGKAMSFPLPLRNFRWMTDEEIENFTMLHISEEDGDGYILEVDLEYPEELHLRHNSFPLAPETMDITEDHLSPYSLECLQQIYKKKTHKAKKLTSTFLPR